MCSENGLGAQIKKIGKLSEAWADDAGGLKRKRSRIWSSLHTMSQSHKKMSRSAIWLVAMVIIANVGEVRRSTKIVPARTVIIFYKVLVGQASGFPERCDSGVLGKSEAEDGRLQAIMASAL